MKRFHSALGFCFFMAGCADVLGVDDVAYSSDDSKSIEAGTSPIPFTQSDSAASSDVFTSDSSTDSSAPTNDANAVNASDAANDANDASDTSDALVSDAAPDTAVATSCDCGGNSCPLWTADSTGGPDHVNCLVAYPGTVLRTCASTATIKGACHLIERDSLFTLYWYCC